MKRHQGHARGHVALLGQEARRGGAGRLARQPADGCMVNPVALGDRPEAFTGFEPVDGFHLLMVVERESGSSARHD
jgi:hypothetical protein